MMWRSYLASLAAGLGIGGFCVHIAERRPALSFITLSGMLGVLAGMLRRHGYVAIRMSALARRTVRPFP